MGGARTVVSSETAGRWAGPGGVIGPHYAASKAGLVGLTHSFAALLAKEGITVNAIAPALIETDMVTTNPNATPERLMVHDVVK